MLSHSKKTPKQHTETHSHRHQNTTTTLLKSSQTLLVGTHHYINSVKLSTTNRQTVVLKPTIYQTPSIGAFDQHNLNYLLSSGLDASSTSTIAPVHLTFEKWPLLAPLLLAPLDPMLASLASFDSLYYFDHNYHSKNVATSNFRHQQSYSILLILTPWMRQ